MGYRFTKTIQSRNRSRKKRKNVGELKELLTKTCTRCEFHINLDLEGFEERMMVKKQN